MKYTTSWHESGLQEDVRDFVEHQIARRFGALSSRQKTALACLDVPRLVALYGAAQELTDVAALEDWLEKECALGPEEGAFFFSSSRHENE